MKWNEKTEPLAHMMRPQCFDDVVGQEHLLKGDGVIRRLLDKQTITSMIFWGPPGSGKTSVVQLIADSLDVEFVSISAIFSGVAELKKIFTEARVKKQQNIQTLLFIDEIHRFNKSQQDSLLPVIEDGTIICIGATTENPSFELNSALLSRMQILVFKPHSYENLEQILIQIEQRVAKRLPLIDDAKQYLINMADGDARILITMAETLLASAQEDEIFTIEQLQDLVQKRAPIYDKNSDSHYNLISAMHKAIRGSDVNAALYYFARMLSAGEDPFFIARRLIRASIEDIGLADPQALVVSNAAKDAYHFLGSPEGELALANACIYLATAPKSTAAYNAYKLASKDALKFGSLTPPKHILNAPTKFMKEQGYGKGYIYDAKEKYSFSGQEYFPEEMGPQQYYYPVEWGFEKELKKRINWWQKLKEKLSRESEN